jgi:hypothetical protein
MSESTRLTLNGHGRNDAMSRSVAEITEPTEGRVNGACLLGTVSV